MEVFIAEIHVFFVVHHFLTGQFKPGEKQARTDRRGEEPRVLVMVHPVELAWLVPHDLEGLHVADGRACQVGDPIGHALRQRMALAFVARAPALEARPHRRELIARQGPRKMRLAARGESLGLIVANKPEGHTVTTSVGSGHGAAVALCEPL